MGGFLRCFLLLPERTQVDAISQDLDQITKAMLGLGSMFAANVETVDVETDLLMGRWHQVSHILFPVSSPEIEFGLALQMYKAAMNFDVFRTSMYCEVAYCELM